MRKKVTLKRTALYAIVVFAIIFVAGCTDNDRTGNTLDEPEITVDYLSDEYANQLLRDGAECIFGNINLSESEDGTVMVTIAAKQYVVDAGSPNGFYIADRNLEHVYPLAPEARATFLSGGMSIASIIEDADGFVRAVNQDLEEYGDDNVEYSKYKLYDIYVMNDQIELLIARYIP